MLISFGKDHDIPLLGMNGTQTERVHHSKLLRVIISDDLKWGADILYINSRAGEYIYYLRELKRSGVLKVRFGACTPDFSPSCSGICVQGVVHWAHKGTKPDS